jgi:DNA anti-recombination protein RmuC
MSYATAKDALRENLAVMLSNKANVNAQDHLLFNIARSLSALTEALEADLAELKARLKQYESLPPQR